MKRLASLVLTLCAIPALTQIHAAGADETAVSVNSRNAIPNLTAAQINAFDILFLVLAVVAICALVFVVLLFVKNKRLNRDLELIIAKRTSELGSKTATLSAIYRSIPDLVFCKDVNSIYTSCNSSFEQFAGVPEDVLVGKSDADVFKIDAEMARLFKEADQRVLRNQSVEVIEEMVTYPDGTQKTLETYKTPLVIDGEVIGMLGISRDISRRKAAEDALEKRFEQQKLMANLSLSFISGGSTDETINRALQTAGEFLGTERVLMSRYENQSLHCLYEWCASGNEEQTRIGEVKPVFEEDLILIEAFGARRITHYNFDEGDLESIIRRYKLDVATLLFLPVYAEGEFWGVIEIDRFGEHKPWTESDIALCEMVSGVMSGVVNSMVMRKGLERMSAIVNSSPQYIAYVNGEGKFDFFNPATHEITGYTYDDLMEGGLQILYDDETNEKIRTEVLPQIFGRGSYNFEIPLVRKDGERRIMSFSAFTIPTDEYGCGTIASDVTEQKLMEKALIEAKELAEANNRSKSEFLSRMSHEIRTPMNAIIGMTNIAKTTESLERKDYCLDKINSASTHLLGVINDVLDMSKIEAGKFELSYDEFNLERMLIRITNVVNFRMEEKGQLFAIKVEPDVPNAIISDEQRLSQVITNLLGNAVKFTPDNGKISLLVRLLGETDGVCDIEFEVKDTGIGVSEEQKNRLFQSFEQADGSISRKYGGTGLGLAISKRIVELMDGSIRVESKVDEGSSFIFRIRAQKGANAPRTLLKPNVNWGNLRIIAVDDDPDVREYFLGLAENAGLSCAVAASGEEALEHIEVNGTYDVIFVDWRMPGMDGVELTRRIKERYGRNTVVIMISAMEWSVIEKEAKDAGVDRFIPKPLFASVIIDCISECLDLTQHLAPVTLSDEAGRFKGRKLLLAEDIDINREIVITLLEPTGIDIDCAEDGGVAFRMFKANPEYDMIFMDIHMPEVDGFESTRMIRALDNPRAKTVPIIAMTANVFREDIEKCIEAGMNDHVGKPIDFDDVLAKLRQYLASMDN